MHWGCIIFSEVYSLLSSYWGMVVGGQICCWSKSQSLHHSLQAANTLCVPHPEHSLNIGEFKAQPYNDTSTNKAKPHLLVLPFHMGTNFFWPPQGPSTTEFFDLWKDTSLKKTNEISFLLKQSIFINNPSRNGELIHSSPHPKLHELFYVLTQNFRVLCKQCACTSLR